MIRNSVHIKKDIEELQTAIDTAMKDYGHACFDYYRSKTFEAAIFDTINYRNKSVPTPEWADLHFEHCKLLMELYHKMKALKDALHFAEGLEELDVFTDINC
jgi:hypothetical protein